MKKYLYIVLAAAALTGCSSDESIEMVEQKAISFDNVFVNNATRAADLTVDNLNDFGVWAFVEANGTQGTILNNETVTKATQGYTYTNTQYWIAKAQYYFTAIAPKTGANWTFTTTDAQNGTITFKNDEANANQDLLFAFNQPEETDDAITIKPAPVGFTFNHLLSRVRFIFENGFAASSNITLKVTNVNITNAHKTGTIAVTNGQVADAWTATDNTLNVAFGNAEEEGENADHIFANGAKVTTEHFYLIPNGSDTQYTVTFDVTLYQAGVKIDTYNHTASATIDLQKGLSYNINAKLTHENTSDDELFPIEFNVTKIENWANFTDETANVTE